MEQQRFMKFRVASSGLPYGELELANQRMQAGMTWSAAFRRSALELCRLARRTERAGRRQSAADAWRWAACAFHAASMGFHLDGEGGQWSNEISRLRRMAMHTYRRAAALCRDLGEWVQIPAPGGGVLGGYLRLPPARRGPLVILFNGLDSLCEVELHMFGEAFLGRGMAVLALDLPAAYNQQPRRPGFAVEHVATALADWAAQRPEVSAGFLSAFGVSFGGHLVARLLAGDCRFGAGVAVSPNAFLGDASLMVPRMRRMLSLTFDLPQGDALDALASRISLDDVPSPKGTLLLLHMEHDQLFGAEHVTAFRAWGGPHVQIHRWPAEHVGTSRIHEWMPFALDWLDLQMKSSVDCEDATCTNN